MFTSKKKHICLFARENSLTAGNTFLFLIFPLLWTECISLTFSDLHLHPQFILSLLPENKTGVLISPSDFRIYSMENYLKLETYARTQTHRNEMKTMDDQCIRTMNQKQEASIFFKKRKERNKDRKKNT